MRIQPSTKEQDTVSSCTVLSREGGDTYSEPLCIVCLGSSEQGVKRVVPRNNEASQVCQELSAEIEDNQEEVEGNKANHCIGLGN